MDPVRLRDAVTQIEESDYQPTKWERGFIRSMKDLVRQGKFTRGAQDDALDEILMKVRNPRARIRPVVQRGWFLLKA